MRTRNRRNFYRILHLQPDAPFDVVQANYRTLMQTLRMHPDLGGDEWNAVLVNAAYATLRDPAKRAAYDRALLREYDIATLAGAGRGPPQRPPPATGKPANRRNYYRVLQVQPDAPTAVIEASYQSLRRSRAVPAGLLDEAHRILSDQDLRAEYDNALAPGDHPGANLDERDRTRRGPSGAANEQGALKTGDAAASTPSGSVRGHGGGRNPWTRATGYQPAITDYCPFCKTPHAGIAGALDQVACTECGSPLGMPRDAHAAQTRRTLPRLERDEIIGFYTYWPGPRQTATLGDLSPNGIQFRAAVNLSNGVVLKIESRGFQATGRVVHCRPAGQTRLVGVQFLTVRFSEVRGGFFSSTA